MTRVRLDELTLPTAPVGAENPLPPLRRRDELHLEPEGLENEEMLAGARYGHVPSTLPYLDQDGYDRTLEPAQHPVVVVENGLLRARFLPGLGGRLWSLTDLRTDRELLYSNRAVQPGNLALRNAWFAGGVEWNLGLIGHTPLTCAPLHASKVVLEDGTEVARMYEYERIRGVVYQIDAWLPEASTALMVSVRIVNPNQHDVPMYWWSNIAVPESDGLRVVAPATTGWAYDLQTKVRYLPMPVIDEVDRSYPASCRGSSEVFFDIDPDTGPRPWIAAIDEDGTGLVQTSTRRLRGRKLFVWGRGTGGRRWQEWLSPEGGSYVEIQAGLARSQWEHLRMPAGETWSWVETYAPITLDPEQAHAAWPEAVAAVAAELERTQPEWWWEPLITVADQFATAAPVETFHAGSGWGALEELRRSHQGEGALGSAGTPFPKSTLGPQQHPWVSLVQRQELHADPSELPPSYQVDPGWIALLEKATGWSAALHLGVARWYSGDVDGALAALRNSIDAQPNPLAWRTIGAVLADDKPIEAIEAYDQAVALAPDLTPLVVERLELMRRSLTPAEVLSAIDAVPESMRTHPRLALVEARAAVAAGDVERAGAILDPGLVVPDLREGETSMDELWRSYRRLRLAQAAGRPADDDFVVAMAETEPLPWVYDFRMN